MTLSVGSVTVADDGTVTKSGMAAEYYDAIIAQESPLWPDPNTPSSTFTGTPASWNERVTNTLINMKKAIARQANALAQGLNDSGGGSVDYGVAAPGPGAGYTIVGTLGVEDTSNGLIVQSAINNKDHHLLKAIPGVLSAGGPWQITLVGVPSFGPGGNYPSFGVMVANGTTPASSVGYFVGMYNYSADYAALGAWFVVLNTQSRPYGLGFGSNSNGAGIKNGPFFFRIVHDTVNFISQFSTDGVSWRVFTSVAANSGPNMTPTHYGLAAGCANGSGFVMASVYGLEMKAIPQITITNMTYNVVGGLTTVTTSTAHGLVTGASISITGVSVSAGTLPNGVYYNSVIVTGTNTFTVPTATMTYLSGGKVINLSR